MKPEIQTNDLKKYYRNEFNKGFYSELRDKIIPLIEKGVNVQQIRKNFYLNNKEIGFLVTYKEFKPKFNKVLGSKTESYYTENEMMKTISYSYDDLSPDEKLIYNEI
jgi:hypothetical protein